MTSCINKLIKLVWFILYFDVDSSYIATNKKSPKVKFSETHHTINNLHRITYQLITQASPLLLKMLQSSFDGYGLAEVVLLRGSAAI